MKKSLMLALALCMAVAVNAQELPYSKYLNFSNKEFKENNFKYHKKTNTWALNKSNGWMMAFNVLAAMSASYEDIRPARNDYRILVQSGKDDKASFVRVVYYNDETYHKILTFIKKHGQNVLETTSGKLIKHQATYSGYELELNMEQKIISRTSAYTAIPGTLKNVDESYNEYEFIIKTNVEPWSKYIEKQKTKQAKRDAKGKKKRSVEELM